MIRYDNNHDTVKRSSSIRAVLLLRKQTFMICGIYIHAQMLLDIDITFMQLCMLYVYANDHACMHDL